MMHQPVDRDDLTRIYWDTPYSYAYSFTWLRPGPCYLAVLPDGSMELFEPEAL